MVGLVIAGSSVPLLIILGDVMLLLLVPLAVYVPSESDSSMLALGWDEMPEMPSPKPPFLLFSLIMEPGLDVMMLLPDPEARAMFSLERSSSNCVLMLSE